MGHPSNHGEWFALYRDDGTIDNVTWINCVKRGQFRLHPAGGRGISLGCTTLPRHSDFMTIRNALLHTVKIPARCSGLLAYGTIEVITYGNTCPWGVQDRSVYRPVLSLLALCPSVPL
ncbi:DUF2778 domain-containing protein [Paraburkholderia sp. MMS20-SJTN17]|uniref:DUF2778 domain-containing protein n=1 Tax=Paraburkholderia translucens TaxID=2886945 RepID=A0ABS8K8Y5_9BURK|nr:DUF2778 domain-containing protein [Paraburkholderia sp. MMS20-SJTN17]